MPGAVPEDQFLRDKTGPDRLPEPDVVGDEEGDARHPDRADEWVELVSVARTPLELLPLLQIRAAPRTEEDACYFYSGIEDGTVKLVSYHFDREATIQEPSPEIVRLITSLSR